MAKTADRQVVNGETYFLRDTGAREQIGETNSALEGLRSDLEAFEETFEDEFDYAVKAFDDLSLYTQQWGAANTILSTKVIQAGTYVEGVRFHAAVTSTASNAWLYIIDNATKEVLKRITIPIRNEWITGVFNFKCPSDCVFGFCGGTMPVRPELVASPDKNTGKYVFSVGLNVGDEAFPDVGDIINVSTTSTNIVFAIPADILITKEPISSASKDKAASEIETLKRQRADDIEVRDIVAKELSFNGISTLRKATETMRGVTYTWDGDSCTIVGTATGGKSQYNMFISNNSFPFWLKPGEKYYIDIKASSVFFRVYAYINGTLVNVADSRKDPLFFTFPDDATGCIIDFEIDSGSTVNETVTPKVFKANFNTNITARTIYTHPPIISFIDDDSGMYAPSIWNEIMNETGIRMGFACVTGFISGEEEPISPGYEQMTVEELRALYDAGNEVYSHSYSHPAFYETTPAEIERQCRLSKQWLDDNGFGRTSDIIVYPGGLGADNKEEQARVRQFYRYGVDTYAGVSDEPIVNPYFVHRFNADTATLEQLTSKIDEAISSNGLLVFMNHAYELNKDRTNEVAKMIAAIEYAKNAGATILPFGEAIRRIYGWSV